MQHVGNSSYGASLSGLADADGDGWGDLVVGARGAHESPEDLTERRGRAYLYSGARAVAVRVFEPVLSWGDPNENNVFGTFVAGLGDVDGDGFGDVAVSAHIDSLPEGPPYAGRAYVFSGATGALLHALQAPVETSTNFGISIAGVPDCDGDGRPEVLAGSPYEGSIGRLHLFSGATGVLIRSLESPRPSLGGRFGQTLAGIPDITGDGAGEIIVGAPLEPVEPGAPMGTGNAYVFSGATGELLFTLHSTEVSSLWFAIGEVGAVPDADGDGCPDLVVGSPEEPPIPSLPPPPGYPYASGRVHLYSGRTGQPLYTLASPAPIADGWFGYSVLGVEDLDGDARGDFFVCARNEGGPVPIAPGRVYLYSGADGRLLRTISTPNPQRTGWFGAGLAAIPDANGDGRTELAIGAPYEDWFLSNGTGRIYLLYSCPADFDASGAVEPADFFAYLDAFLDQRPGADFDRSGSLDSSDFFAYLIAFFAGCG
jgi:hypothetical protein